jgi:hypothetical protein
MVLATKSVSPTRTQVRSAAEEVVKRFPQCAQAWLLLSDAAAAAHGKTASVAVLREALNHCGVVGGLRIVFL